MERETFPFDVLVIGGGPAGLAAALRAVQIAKEQQREVQVGVVEKAPQCGLHCLSGAILNPTVLEELVPDHAARGFTATPVVRDEFHYLTATRALKVPGPLVPPRNKNHGYVAVSIQKLVSWLAEIAEAEGVTILTDTCATEILYGDGGEVVGVRTGDKGLGHDGKPQANHQPGYDLLAKVTIFAEGPYGTLAEDLMHRKGMRAASSVPQIYSLGVKEAIRNDPGKLGIRADQGFAIHTLGFPAPDGAFGGGFLYHLGGGLFSVGYVLGLSWKNPALDMHAVFNEYKKHPLVQRWIRGGEVLTYGAKTIPEGGFFALPRLHCDGALVVGDSAGLVNVRTLKGIHYAMKSGMLAAETAVEAVVADDASERALAHYRTRLDGSFVMADLWRDRNFRASFDHGLHRGLLHVMLNDVTGGGPRTPRPHPPDHRTLGRAHEWGLHFYPRQDYDARLVHPKLTDVHLSGTSHREDQPSHIRILDGGHCLEHCIPAHGHVAPCTFFCPAQVYELKAVPDAAGPIQVNFSNCVHCRTCVILDPCDVDGSDHVQNIDWRAPAEGGPRYVGL